jgi:hypothetical protein
MMVFADREDVQEWLAPFDYVAFWKAMEPYSLTLQDRDHCDGLIARGTLTQDVILEGLKYMADLELARAFGLSHRTYHPTDPTRQPDASVH